MRITEKQLAFLNTLTCQRLTADPENKKLIKNFRCNRNKGLAAQLRYYAWEEDSSGATTYYIIKNTAGEILLYFSLKCGSVFDPIDKEELLANIRRYRELLELIHTRKPGVSRDRYMAQLNQLEREFDMPLYQLDYYLRSEVNIKKEKIRGIEQDMAQELNPHISRVSRTYPAVELVHFVANDSAKALWTRCGIRQSMGEVLFWHFICPIITRIQESLGCQYAYLFAADMSRNQNLITYYEVRLRFEQTDKLGTSKPVYDFTCPFMCQNIEDMTEYREYYFDTFNPDENDILV